MRDQAARFLEQYLRESLGSRHPALTILRRLSAQVHSGHLITSFEPRFNNVLFRWITWPRSLEMESVAFEKSSLSSWRMIFHLSRFQLLSFDAVARLSTQSLDYNEFFTGYPVWSGSLTTCLPH